MTQHAALDTSTRPTKIQKVSNSAHISAFFFRESVRKVVLLFQTYCINQNLKNIVKQYSIFLETQTYFCNIKEIEKSHC